MTQRGIRPTARTGPIGPQDQTRAPAALTWTSLVLAVGGLAVSAYLTFEHYSGSTSLSCPDTGRINCLKVTTSEYSDVAGAPVALLGLLFFVAVVVAMSPPLWRLDAPVVRYGRVGLMALGICFVLYLVWAEFYRLDAICLWCTAVHVITFLLFVTVVFAEAARTPVLEPVG